MQSLTRGGSGPHLLLCRVVQQVVDVEIAVRGHRSAARAAWPWGGGLRGERWVGFDRAARRRVLRAAQGVRRQPADTPAAGGAVQRACPPGVSSRELAVCELSFLRTRAAAGRLRNFQTISRRPHQLGCQGTSWCLLAAVSDYCPSSEPGECVLPLPSKLTAASGALQPEALQPRCQGIRRVHPGV